MTRKEEHEVNKFMETASRDAVARRFNKLRFHDDNLASVTVSPAQTRTNVTRIDFEFRSDATDAKKTLSFGGCANLRFLMDFDVLADNWVGQTDHATCQSDASRMKRFVRAQKSHWHVQYMPPMPKDAPIRKKLSVIRAYRLFRITFFGGTAEVLAKNFTVRISNAEASAPAFPTQIVGTQKPRKAAPK